jgi:cobalt-zinc-cadmium efflux system protein
MASHDHNVQGQQHLGSTFGWAVALNGVYVLVEAGFGFSTGSLALLADAAHNLTDVFGLVVAWSAAALVRRQPSERHTYGLGRGTILAALANAVALLIGVGAIVWEAIGRFSAPGAVPAGTVLLVALMGIAINGGTALLFLSDRGRDLNVRGAFLHMVGDAAVSGGVVASALIILATGSTWVDPVTAIFVSALIGWSAFGLLRSALHLSLDGVPASVDRGSVEAWLRQLAGVASVHDLHIWALSTTSTALTAHLVMPEERQGDAFLESVAHELDERFGIAHTTLQIEDGSGAECRLAPEDRP